MRERAVHGPAASRSLASSASRSLEASPEFRRVVASLTSRDGPGGKSDASAREAVREGAASFANRRFRDALARLDDACRRARCPALVAEIHARRATAHLKLAQVEARASGPWTARRARSLDARLRAAARECDRALRTLDDDVEASTAREPGPVERREPSSAGASRDRTRAAAYLRRGAARHALGDLERALEDVLSAVALLPLGSAASDAARTRADAIRRAKPSKTSKAAASKTSKAAPSPPPPASSEAVPIPFRIRKP